MRLFGQLGSRLAALFALADLDYLQAPDAARIGIQDPELKPRNTPNHFATYRHMTCKRKHQSTKGIHIFS